MSEQGDTATIECPTPPGRELMHIYRFSFAEPCPEPGAVALCGHVKRGRSTNADAEWGSAPHHCVVCIDLWHSRTFGSSAR